MIKIIASLLFLFTYAAQAEDIPVVGDAITKLLSDRTAIGVWDDEPYRQYFGADGFTFYAPKNATMTNGEWRVSSDGSQYESWWRFSGWARYRIVLSDGVYYWIGSGGKRHPFEMVDGKQLDWE